MLNLDLGTADRIAAEVLPASLIEGAGGLPAIRMCACQYGVCGRCKDLGHHDQCTTRVGFQGARKASPAAWLAGIPVQATGRACAWRCPCPVCIEAVRLPEPVQLDLLAVVA
ncbi:DUF6248 family natural product biosynthesis protein [Actinoplanes sp. N902-109]|uniref:DUF6248 family natural product biosynthesis protein n=1 Tax=Actinoplanes sp. (strain N902-109) TaxID=649831 RepID=UPI0003295188|nr:DUF6248 family natural product biosynthesis protein [Actinoplanes sp. N902-109]AGL13853.1 hypothetical protein L083_0343 [Actinoplanes sp. N902-109]